MKYRAKPHGISIQPVHGRFSESINIVFTRNICFKIVKICNNSFLNCNQPLNMLINRGFQKCKKHLICKSSYAFTNMASRPLPNLIVDGCTYEKFVALRSGERHWPFTPNRQSVPHRRAPGATYRGAGLQGMGGGARLVILYFQPLQILSPMRRNLVLWPARCRALRALQLARQLA